MHGEVRWLQAKKMDGRRRNDLVIIFAKDWLQRNKASRILARKGFKELYAAKGCFLKSEEAFGCHEQQYSS